MATTTPTTKSQIVRSLGAPVKSSDKRAPKDDEYHTDHEQGNPDDAVHRSFLLRSSSIIGKETRALLRIVPSSIIELRCRRVSMAGRELDILQPRAILERCGDKRRAHRMR